MKILMANDGSPITVDDDTYEWAHQHKWYAAGRYFVRHSRETGNNVLLHREVLGAKTGQRVTALDGNYANCRRSNLRLASRRTVAPGKVEITLHVAETIAELLTGYFPQTADESEIIAAFTAQVRFAKERQCPSS